MTNRPSRRRGALRLPRSAWPIAFALAATPGQDARQRDEAIQATSNELDEQLRDRELRSETRWLAVDADEADDVLLHLGVPADSHTELRAFCRLHPGGLLVIAWADYQPNPRRHIALG